MPDPKSLYAEYAQYWPKPGCTQEYTIKFLNIPRLVHKRNYTGDLPPK